MMRNDTDGAREYASDTSHNAREIDAHWWELFSNYRLKRWQAELRRLTRQNDVTLEEISEYTGLSMSDRAGFFTKLPKKRKAYIGIGMALGQPVETIDRWICKYGMKQSLYPKDICGDLIWIYLINANMRDPDRRINYYQMFDRCADMVYRTYCDLWEDYIEHDEGTSQLLREVQEVSFDPEFEGIREFVIDHLDAFKTAYAKPRRLLAEYVRLLQRYMEEDKGAGKERSLSDLRGYLDDSMINYLSGDPETIHALDRSGGRHTSSFKHIPKGRKNHISLAMALGMTRHEIDQYLRMMGFTPLDAVDQEEGILINMLQKWEREHPLQRRLKEQELGEEGKGEAESAPLTGDEAKRAVREMLHLRRDLNEEYKDIGRKCPYLKE